MKKYVFCQTRGGGDSEGVDKTILLFLKSIYQKPFRTSLGPPKHVLHLVWRDSDITTAINIALKLACLGQFMAMIL